MKTFLTSLAIGWLLVAISVAFTLFSLNVPEWPFGARLAVPWFGSAVGTLIWAGRLQ